MSGAGFSSCRANPLIVILRSALRRRISLSLGLHGRKIRRFAQNDNAGRLFQQPLQPVAVESGGTGARMCEKRKLGASVATQVRSRTAVTLNHRHPRRSVLPRTLILVCLAAVAFFLSLPSSAAAWGCKGHQVVALLAEKHLTPHALAMVNQILRGSPVDPGLSRYCKEGGIDPMADASTWPDDVRTQRPETPPWHYIDIPLGTTHREVEKYCDPQEHCVTWAISDELKTLRSTDADLQKKADALRFLIHFVADLHQPLHAVTNNDWGGNCVPVAFFNEQPQLRNPQLEIYAPNLHAVWDINILERATADKTAAQVVSDLDESFRRKIRRWQKGPADVDSWARESYRLAAKNVYGKLPERIPVEAPQPTKSCADDNHISARMLKLNERLDDAYQKMAAPIVRERLAQAGARLALLLNRLWPIAAPTEKSRRDHGSGIFPSRPLALEPSRCGRFYCNPIVPGRLWESAPVFPVIVTGMLPVTI